MITLAADYFILCLCICLGALQVAAAWSGLRGLLIVPSVRISYLLGLALPTGAFAWFITIGDAAIPGDVGGVEGAEQFTLFFGAAATAALLSAALASITQARQPRGSGARLGLDALRDATLLQALLRLLRRRDDRW